jgi:hydroxyproline O-arabinosyltransferase
LQWVEQAKITEEYVLMSEPDHVFLRPLQNLMRGENPAAFPFFYIEPSRKDYVHITQKFIGSDKSRKDCEEIAPIGSSPTFLRFDDLRTIAASWVNTSIAIFQDPEANKVRAHCAPRTHLGLDTDACALCHCICYGCQALLCFMRLRLRPC